MLSSWYIFAILSVFALAGSEFSQKVSLSHKVNISAVTNNFFVWIFQGLGGLVLISIFREPFFDFSVGLFFKLLLIGLIYFAGGTFYYTSYKANSPSISMILVSISVIITTVLGILLFGETTVPVKLLGISLILISIVFINYNKQFKIGKYNLYALLGGVCFGIAYTVDKSFILSISPSVYLVLMCFSVAIVSFLLRGKFIISEIKTLSRENFIRIVLISIFGTLFNFFTFKSYQLGGSVGVVDALNNSAIFIVILLEIYILKDRTLILKKIVLSVIAILGVILLSFV